MENTELIETLNKKIEDLTSRLDLIERQKQAAKMPRQKARDEARGRVRNKILAHLLMLGNFDRSDHWICKETGVPLRTVSDVVNKLRKHGIVTSIIDPKPSRAAERRFRYILIKGPNFDPAKMRT